MKKKTKSLFSIITVTTITGIFLLAGCGKKSSYKMELTGAGATFPYPLYSKMFNEYYRETGVKVNYQAIGSGGGIKQLLKRVVDFGGTDAFMSKEELKKADGEILHIPTCIGAVVISYNLPGNPELKLTPELISDIFLGKIRKWNDAKIKRVNPQIVLPDMKITVIHRSDGSGTTYIFSDYLSKVSMEWKTKMGRGKSLNWVVGVGAKGNAGVAGLIKQTPGSIGYVELIYALQNNMKFAAIQNKKGNFIKPSLESVSLSAQINIPDDTRVSITDTDAEYGYPISSFTWIIFYKEQNYNSRDRKKAEELVKLLWWMTHEGQKFTKELNYAPLSDEAVKKAEKILKSVTYNGKKILTH